MPDEEHSEYFKIYYVVLVSKVKVPGIGKDCDWNWAISRIDLFVQADNAKDAKKLAVGYCEQRGFHMIAMRAKMVYDSRHDRKFNMKGCNI